MTSPYIATSSRLSAMRVQGPSVGCMRAYVEMCGMVSDRYDQQDRRPGKYKWLRSIKGEAVPVTNQDLIDHLNGRATYAATYADANGMTMLLVADDDSGGLARAQEAVDNLKAMGFDAFAVARSSIDGYGQPKHDGSKVCLRLAGPQPTADAKRAYAAILAKAGYPTTEVMFRAELPFGRSKWTPAGDEFGQLVLANRPPQRITSGWQGMELLEAARLTPADPAYLMDFAPALPAPTPKPTPATTRDDVEYQYTHAEVVARFNDTNTVHDVFAWAGWKQVGKRNYRCRCAGHSKRDEMPSVGISADGTLAYFNTPGCQYHNDKRGYTAFSLYQTLEWRGDYHDAVRDARAMLNMPAFKKIEKNKPVSSTPAMKPATVEPHEPITIARILEDIKRRLETDLRLTESELYTLRAIARRCLETGACTASWDDLADDTGKSNPTVRRAAARLVYYGLIAKKANATERGGWAPNVFQILPQPVTEEPETAVITTPVSEFDQSILSTIKEGECIGEFAETEPVQIPATLLFNGPLIQTVILETFEIKRARWAKGWQRRCEREYGQIPARLRAERMERAERVSLTVDDETFWTRAAGRSAQSWPLKPTPKHTTRQAPQPAEDEPADTPQLAHWRRVVNLMRHAAMQDEDGIRPMGPAAVGEVGGLPKSPSLIAPAPQATPADTGHNAPSLEAQMDAAAARGDKAGLLALLDQLGAWDRALANAKYDAVLCKFKRAGRAA